jgi:hypothetical protein
MTKWIAPIAAVVGFVLVTFADPIQALVVAHPAYAGLFAALGAIAAAFAPQPHK